MAEIRHNPVARGCIIITTPPLPAHLLRDDVTCPACDAVSQAIERAARAGFIQDSGQAPEFAGRVWDKHQRDHAVKDYWRAVAAVMLAAAEGGA